MKELRVRLQYLKDDNMAEAVDDVLRLIRREAIERGFECVEIGVDRLGSWDDPFSEAESVDGRFFRMPSDRVMECFGCHSEIGKVHKPNCPVAGSRVS